MTPGRLQTLRADFDRSFAEPVRHRDTAYVELLAVRAGGRPYALRLAQTAGLFPDRPVTALPGPAATLLGVAGFGGAVVPVHDLAALLGHPGPHRPRWLVLAAGSPPLALAFHALDGHVRVPETALAAAPAAEARHDCRTGTVTLADGVRAVVDVAAARGAVARLTGHVDEES